SGPYWKSKVSIGSGQVKDVPIPVAAGTTCRLSGAIWWPETQAGGPNDVDLEIVDPSGNVRAQSIAGLGVFEMARVNGPLAAGTWKPRGTAFDAHSTQPAYAAATPRRR